MVDMSIAWLFVLAAFQALLADIPSEVSGRLGRDDGIVLQLRYGEGRGWANMPGAVSTGMPRRACPGLKETMGDHFQGWRDALQVRQQSD